MCVCGGKKQSGEKLMPQDKAEREKKITRCTKDLALELTNSRKTTKKPFPTEKRKIKGAAFTEVRTKGTTEKRKLWGTAKRNI